MTKQFRRGKIEYVDQFGVLYTAKELKNLIYTLRECEIKKINNREHGIIEIEKTQHIYVYAEQGKLF